MKPMLSGSCPEGPHDPSAGQEELRQIERIIASDTFLNSPRLRAFLLFVAERTHEGRIDEIKEYTIGTNVFGKAVDFDPRIDTVVRTQANRLRLRLQRYYSTEGASDELLVEIPKGRYVPQFSRRQLTSLTQSVDIGTLARATGLSKTDENVTALWSVLADRRNPPMLVFSNAMFLTNEQYDLFHYAGPASAPPGVLVPESVVRQVPGLSAPKNKGPLYFNIPMTGVGEVAAVYNLTRVLTSLGRPLILKRGRLLTTDDLQDRDLIFVGSPSVNWLLGDLHLHLASDFVFDDYPKDPAPLWKERLINLHPQAGENPSYGVERDEASRAIIADYALVSFQPGVSPGRIIVTLAGLTSDSTQAATEFATSPEGTAKILSALGSTDAVNARKFPPYFQVVLRVEYAKGMILKTRYVTGRIMEG